MLHELSRATEVSELAMATSPLTMSGDIGSDAATEFWICPPKERDGTSGGRVLGR
jgi:hypothetical protein